MKKISGMLLGLLAATAAQSEAQTAPTATVLHAARLLDIESGRMISPAEILVRGERIAAVGSSVTRTPETSRSKTSTSRPKGRTARVR